MAGDDQGRTSTEGRPRDEVRAPDREIHALVRDTVDEDAAADRLVHQRTRLAILSALAVLDHLSFTELRELLEISDGSLSVHARKLEQAGYLDCSKSFEDRVPRTEYRLTPPGRRRLERYLDHMEKLSSAVR